jgi:hypothetical protein
MTYGQVENHIRKAVDAGQTVEGRNDADSDLALLAGAVLSLSEGLDALMSQVIGIEKKGRR